jgi:hypothetical protein
MTPRVCLVTLGCFGAFRHRIAHSLLSIFLGTILVPACFSLDAATQQKLQDAAQKGIDLAASTQGNLDVKNNVSVEAVLLPSRVCQEVFGKEIAHNYAAVEVIISNRNRDASLIVHSVFIDYSNWALSGALGASLIDRGNATELWQAATKRNQIASVEYRIVRGELLDRQPWTARNIVIRSLVAAGSLATAYTFVTTDQDIIRGIAAFAGTGVPAAQTLWPDGTVGQMNRISDVGFQVNKVIPKDSSDIVVAFFPIDRFLTPGLKQLFLKSPALFFAPGAIVVDTKAKHYLKSDLETLLGNKARADDFLKKMPGVYSQKVACEKLPDEPQSAPEKGADQKIGSIPDQNSTEAQVDGNMAAAKKQCHDLMASFVNNATKTTTTNPAVCDEACVARTMILLDAASLNNVRVVVGGIMTVDVSTVPATITGVTMEGGNDNADVLKPGVHSGTIKGSYLTGATPEITAADGTNLESSAITDGSTDTTLRFKVTIPENFTAQTVKVKAVKKGKDGKDIESMALPVSLGPANAAPPAR